MNRKIFLCLALLLSLSAPLWAADTGQGAMMEQIATLQSEWARIKYQVSDKEMQTEAMGKLAEQAAAVTAQFTDRPEPKIWEGIILSTYAGMDGGLGALGKVKKAKGLFESSIAQDGKALEGAAYTSLGSLYYQVPGWPISFGNDEKAEEYLKQALQISPADIDSNFFYADFLIEEERFDEAKVYLERALSAPERPGRILADAGRRQEVEAALAKINRNGKNT
ncbi:MAG: hypothetical protein C0622_07815 [Desulfuromonas sp.]|mgnify:CR=1 FL=1|nr:MAG: hypothetical protein C0622_07815 [Desulfuromonas sp.]